MFSGLGFCHMPVDASMICGHRRRSCAARWCIQHLRGRCPLCCGQVVRRTWDWLAEQPEDAAELAVLLYEAAPKLNIAASSAAGRGAASRAAAAAKTPRRASGADREGGLRERLAAAVPMPIGACARNTLPRDATHCAVFCAQGPLGCSSKSHKPLLNFVVKHDNAMTILRRCLSTQQES